MVDFAKLLDRKRNPAPAMVLSTYQEAIREWVVDDTGSAAIDAKAGSGKTSTLVKVVAPEVRGRATFLAFNKHIADELGARLPPHVGVSTIHSAGLRAVKRRHPGAQVEADKSKKLVSEISRKLASTGRAGGQTVPGAKTLLSDVERSRDVWSKSVKLIDLCRVTLTDPADTTALLELASGHDLDLVGAELTAVSAIVDAVLLESRRTASRAVDFADMIWLPAIDPEIRPDQNDWVLVDEAQDLSAAQLAVARKLLAPGGRLLAVGDPRQAIYGFAGSDTDSFGKVVAFAGGRVLPLNVCYRCPTSHLELAREIVPDIEAAPGAIEGVVRRIAEDELAKEATAKDLVICRLTSPLVSLCLRMVRAGTPAFVRGQDLAASLKNLVGSIMEFSGSSDRKVSRLLAEIDPWLASVNEAMDARRVPADAPARIAIEDKAAAIKFVAGTLNPRAPISDIFPVFVEIFRERPGSVVLSTVHRAKGLEADRVFIASEDKMPHPLARRPEAIMQEWNLRYVALTRARKELVFLDRE